MAINKIVYGGETLIDLTADTATKDKVLSGYTFHGKDGVQVVGECTYDSNTQDADLQVAEALEGKIFYGNGARKVGTMPNIGKQTGAISTKDGTVNIQQGYHDGSASIGIAADQKLLLVAGNIKNGVTILGVPGTYAGDSIEKPQAKTVTPSKVQQVISPDDGYTCLSQVTVKPIPYVESANAYGTTVTIG